MTANASTPTTTSGRAEPAELEAPALLVIDDDETFRERLALAFRRRGYDVRSAASAAEGVRLAEASSPEFAIVDLRMPGEWGLHAVRDLMRIDPTTRVVLLTAYGSIATALEAVRLGAVNFLQKPASVDEIERAFREADAAVGDAPIPPGEVPSLARAEWEHISRVLTECDGNVRRAATLLGLHRRTLQRKLAKYPVLR
jgi:two-component system response regulator RegA